MLLQFIIIFFSNINSLLIWIFILNSWLARTDPADVARVESKTFVVTPQRNEAVPNCKEGVNGQLGNWMSSSDLQKNIQDRFPNCMKGF